MKSLTIRAIAPACVVFGLVFLATGCANMSTGVGISFPVGPFGSIGVGVGSDGRVGASVGVGVGAATVSVGTSGTLPQSQKTDPAHKSEPVANADEEKKQ
jgi:hypothetical protein